MRGAPADIPDDEQVAALISIGVPAAEARRGVAAQWDPAEARGDASQAYRVMQCNWQAVCLFAELPPAAWDMPPLGGKVRGLRRDQVVNELILRGVKRPAWPTLWERLRVMEDVVIGHR